MSDDTPIGISHTKIRVTYIDATTEEEWLTMRALARVERQGITPMMANAYMLALAYEVLQPRFDNYEAWADATLPVRIAEVQVTDEDPT